MKAFVGRVSIKSLVAGAMGLLAAVVLSATPASAQSACTRYFPGMALTPGCYSFFPLAAGTPIRRDPTTGLPTNMTLGIDTDNDKFGGKHNAPPVVYDSATKGQMNCNALSYRSDVLECTMQIHIKATITGPLGVLNGHIAVFAGAPPCCNYSGNSTGELLWYGFQYPGGGPAQFTMDGGNGSPYWYLVLSTQTLQVPYNVNWTDEIPLPNSGGKYQFEIRGSFPPFWVCAHGGCKLAL
jgi:hypothetical protein